MDIAIGGGGIGGLTLALALHPPGLRCRVYDGAPEAVCAEGEPPLGEQAPGHLAAGHLYGA